MPGGHWSGVWQALEREVIAVGFFGAVTGFLISVLIITLIWRVMPVEEQIHESRDIWNLPERPHHLACQLGLQARLSIDAANTRPPCLRKRGRRSLAGP